MQITQFCRTTSPFAAVCRRHLTAAWRQRAEDRIEPPHDLRLAANHQAVTALESPDAAAGPHVHVMDAALLELRGPADVVVIVRIAAIDNHIVWREQWRQLLDRRVDDGRRHHQDEVAWRGQRRDEVGQRMGADRSFARERVDAGRRDVLDHCRISGAQQPADHVPAHPAEPDHPELHRPSRVVR